ncbi:MAG: thioredoxin [Hyphomicrobiales bacterium]|nr:thioredoxin [Hyphomicrobiales bacterium]
METPILNAGPGGAEIPDAELIKDTTTNDFVADVIEASRKAPVLVDFWAPWCGPCKQLTPILERLVKAAKGAVRLVKLNIDEHPAIPGQMGVQSIPAVFAFKDGRPVDGFMGAVPESQIKAFIERIGGAPADDGLDAAIAEADAQLEAGDINAAAQIYGAVLQQEAQNVNAIAGLAKCYIRSGDLERAEQTLALAPPNQADAGPIASAAAALDLAQKSADAGDTESLRRAVESQPADFQARYDLAIALNAQGDHEGAMEHLLAIIARDRAWNDEAARKQLVQFFEAWGPKDPATVRGRQQLSSLLFA